MPLLFSCIICGLLLRFLGLSVHSGVEVPAFQRSPSEVAQDDVHKLMVEIHGNVQRRVAEDEEIRVRPAGVSHIS